MLGVITLIVTHTVLAAAVLSDFSLLCLGSCVFVQFVLIMN